MTRRYLTQAEVDELPDGARVEVTWTGRSGAGVYRVERSDYTPIRMWAVSIHDGCTVGPLNQVGAAPPATLVRLADDSDE